MQIKPFWSIDTFTS